jgi:hypothetical protein
LYAFLFSRIRATCPIHLMFLDFIYLKHLAMGTNHGHPYYVVFCSLFIISFTLGQNTLLSIMFWTPSISVLLLTWKTTFHTQKQNNMQKSSIYVNLFILK